MLVLQLVFALTLLSACFSFHMTSTGSFVSRTMKSSLSMEYIPDGLTKKQWAAIKKKEADDKKARGDMAAMGTRRFKSRSFEAWQKAGGKHLFPVNPNEVPYEERPYMQRRNGDWEGSDLAEKGLKGKGQGKFSLRNDLDNLYEAAKKAGKLDSASIFGGKNLPWTSEAANKMDNSKEKTDLKKAPKAVAAKKLSDAEMKRLKANLFKPVDSKKKEAEDAKLLAKGEKPKKKGLFGF